MSAGNLLGSIGNTILLSGLWVVLGAVFDKMFKVFNISISVLPTMQDAANGFSIQQVAWSIVMIIVFFVIWMNYLFNESSQASGGV